MSPLQAPILHSDVFGFTERNWRTLHAVFSCFSTVKEVLLFGSRASGTHRPYSDIDFCIINLDFDQQQYLSIVAAFEESDLPFFVDVLVWHRLQNEALKAEITRTGKVFYTQL
ncbi:MAG: nucleotidyltransferase domain-containing protein [Sphingobacteriaceae bacterium]|nr:MAG: nucleotidyltransferase domain-containing protein [Sphingobacteriaceae bacterium]